MVLKTDSLFELHGVACRGVKSPQKRVIDIPSLIRSREWEESYYSADLLTVIHPIPFRDEFSARAAKHINLLL